MEEKKVEFSGGGHDDEVDEFFGDDHGDDEHDSDGGDTLAARELAALTTRLTTLGYQDGVEDGVQEVVQEGFDKGYKDGAAAGWEAGMFYGAAAATAAALARHTPKLSTSTTGGASVAIGQEQDGDGDGVEAEQQEGRDIDVERAEERASDAQLPQTKNEGDGRQEREHGSSVGSLGELSALVEELRRASLLGPDVPQLDREKILSRLRLAGSPGAAVAAAVDE